ncbi:hypothetical protein ASC54_03115 [Yonghaparkia sp. Root332]|nr:hypothetical protein ASC54_03115 [Yonghaparkia sp. Root332]
MYVTPSTSVIVYDCSKQSSTTTIGGTMTSGHSASFGPSSVPVKVSTVPSSDTVRPSTGSSVWKNLVSSPIVTNTTS